MSKTVKVAVKRPNCGLEVIETVDELKTWQDIVGGWLEVVPFGDHGILLWCNEEGKIHNLPENFSIGYDVIVGNAFFSRSDEDGEIASLTEADINLLNKFFGKMSG